MSATQAREFVILQCPWESKSPCSLSNTFVQSPHFIGPKTSQPLPLRAGSTIVTETTPGYSQIAQLSDFSTGQILPNAGKLVISNLSNDPSLVSEAYVAGGNRMILQPVCNCIPYSPQGCFPGS